jgi:hypothetical protein
MKIKSGFLFSMIVSAVTLTLPLQVSARQVHTWHNINAENGEWVAKLQMLNEKGIFVLPDGTSVSEFKVSTGSPKRYGFEFDPNDDFDVAYTLTLVQQNENAGNQSNSTMFKSKACVYVITADGPAKPDIRVSSFNGAACDWKTVPGVGEDFFVS